VAAGGVASADGVPPDCASVLKVPAVKTAAKRNIMVVFIVLVLIVVLPVPAAASGA